MKRVFARLKSVVTIGVVVLGLPAQAWASEAAAVYGWGELLQYAMCALAVAAAASGIGVVAAIAACIYNELFG